MAHKFELDIATDDQKMLAQIVEYYHRTLKASQEAMAYLTWRGISNNQVIERFRIGYADRTLGLKLPSKKVKAGSDIRNRLEKLGLFRESGHEHFTGSLVFPITACDGTRRIVADTHAAGDIRHRRTGSASAASRVPLGGVCGFVRAFVWVTGMSFLRDE